jgi:hypothetical protein
MPIDYDCRQPPLSLRCRHYHYSLSLPLFASMFHFIITFRHAIAFQREPPSVSLMSFRIFSFRRFSRQLPPSAILLSLFFFSLYILLPLFTLPLLPPFSLAERQPPFRLRCAAGGGCAFAFHLFATLFGFMTYELAMPLPGFRPLISSSLFSDYFFHCPLILPPPFRDNSADIFIIDAAILNTD